MRQPIATMKKKKDQKENRMLGKWDTANQRSRQ
uniref:Uncharacterized protein n=1 Tax=Rhizophora mucronata TaxID=61149 RepID=A0A2P2QNH7_RHIMU